MINKVAVMEERQEEEAMLTLAVANIFKGVGKTTATLRLAEALRKLGQRVLLIDLDPEMERNLTHASRCMRLAPRATHALYDDREEGRQLTPFYVGAALALVPACSTLLQGDVRHVRAFDQCDVLSEFLRHAHLEVYGQRYRLGEMFDVLLMDCPPDMSHPMAHSVVAADHILILDNKHMIPDHERRGFDFIGRYAMTMDLVHRYRSRNGRATRDVCTVLQPPFDARLSPVHAASLGEVERAACADEQGSYWQCIARRINAAAEAGECLDLPGLGP
jgi:AAA domain